MNIEDIQDNEHYEAVTELASNLVKDMQSYIELQGGNGEEFRKWFYRGEAFEEVFEAVFAAMPNDYGVKTKS